VTIRVRLALPDGSSVDLAPGAIIGRLQSAALRLDDPRVSEAHALVSLRGDALWVLGLRGVIAVDGRVVGEAPLAPGMRLNLTPDVALDVLEVHVPDAVLGLALDGRVTAPLRDAVYSVLVDGTPHSGFRQDAAAHIWTTGAGYSWRVGNGAPQVAKPGDTVVVAGRTLRFEELPTAESAVDETRGTGRLDEPMRIVARYGTVQLHRARHDTVVVSGVPARIVSELVALGGQAAWEVIAREIWRDGVENYALRRRWDRNLATLRSKLRQAGVRDDLVTSAGTGDAELVLRPGDVLVDET
jgi:pSer/pThr/pTyr-binding forkhead associated (FHA) protein